MALRCWETVSDTPVTATINYWVSFNMVMMKFQYFRKIHYFLTLILNSAAKLMLEIEFNCNSSVSQNRLYMFREEEEEDELEDETEEAETQLFLPESMIENKIPPAGVANSPVKEWGGQLNKCLGFT